MIFSTDPTLLNRVFRTYQYKSSSGPFLYEVDIATSFANWIATSQVGSTVYSNSTESIMYLLHSIEDQTQY